MTYTKTCLIFACFFVALPLSQQNVVRSAEEEPVEANAIAGVSKNPDDIAFYLYSNAGNKNEAQLLKFNDVNSIVNSKYNPSKRVIIYASGFLQNYTSDQAIKDAYLTAGFAQQANIIVVDWGHLSGNKATFPTSFVDLFVIRLYDAAKQNVPIVGRRIQEFITFLESNGLLSGPQIVHLVGQSLGAHVHGMVGLYYQQVTGKSIARITGTDPAGPLFQGINKNNRLDATDAEFVDIVHTDAGNNGYSGSLGDADFNVNGGKAVQPGCEGQDGYCSHNLAVTYFAKSILDTSIRAYDKNNNEWQFGEYCPSTAVGVHTVNITPDY